MKSENLKVVERIGKSKVRREKLKVERGETQSAQRKAQRKAQRFDGVLLNKNINACGVACAASAYTLRALRGMIGGGTKCPLRMF